MRKRLLLTFLFSFVFVYSVVSSLVIKKPSLQVNLTKQPSSLLLIGDVDVTNSLLHAIVNREKVFSLFEKIIVINTQQLKTNSEETINEKVEFIESGLITEFSMQQIFDKHQIKGVIVLTCSTTNTNLINMLMKQIDKTTFNPWIIHGKTLQTTNKSTQLKSNKNLHIISLRFSSIYGGKYNDGVIESMVGSMLSDQPIVSLSTRREFDFIHIQDVVKAIILSILHIDKLSRTNRERIVEEIDICSGEKTSLVKLYHLLKIMTNAKRSPILFHPNNNNNERDLDFQFTTTAAEKVLGFKASVSIRNGLLFYLQNLYLTSLRQLQQQGKQHHVEESINYKKNMLYLLHELEIIEESQLNFSETIQTDSKEHCIIDCNNIIPCLKNDDCQCTTSQPCSHH